MFNRSKTCTECLKRFVLVNNRKYNQHTTTWFVSNINVPDIMFFLRFSECKTYRSTTNYSSVIRYILKRHEKWLREERKKEKPETKKWLIAWTYFKLAQGFASWIWTSQIGQNLFDCKYLIMHERQTVKEQTNKQTIKIFSLNQSPPWFTIMTRRTP